MRIITALFALTVAAHAGTFTLWASSVRPDFQTDIFLEALAMKETGAGWNGQPGPCGELSRWQIMPVVWRQHMGSVPFVRAFEEKQARVCALRHIAWLRARIIAAGHKPTPERVATCWHYGASHRSRSSVWGQEVANLYDSLTQ
jgi:hypothetical protein